MPVPSTNPSFPGVLNSKELLVAEAIQARAWAALIDENRASDDAAAQAKLGRIVIKLMVDRSQSIDGLTAAAIAAFREDRS